MPLALEHAALDMRMGPPARPGSDGSTDRYRLRATPQATGAANTWLAVSRTPDSALAAIERWVRREALAALRAPIVAAPVPWRTMHAPASSPAPWRWAADRRGSAQARWQVQRRASIQWLTFPPRQRSQG